MRPLIFEKILQTLRWKGTQMIFPYTLNGYNKRAVLKLKDLYKIIKWENCDI